MDKGNYLLERDGKHGFLRVTPSPSDEEIRKFYAQEFYSGEYKNFNNSTLEVQERDAEYHQMQRGLLTATVELLLGSGIEGKRVLDYGCGWGLTLQFLRTKGASCYGLDPSPEAVQYCQAKGLMVNVGDIDNFGSLEDHTYDVVLMQNVLEHLKDPEGALMRLSERLRPGGVIVCSVPNDFNELQVCATEIYGLREWWVAPPAHLNYFNRDSLQALLAGCGFSTRHLECSFPIEMFLLFGDNYIGNPILGRTIHEKRMNFEMALKQTGREQLLLDIYQKFAELGVGRILSAFAVKI